MLKYPPPALVVQWIEQLRPKEEMWVRFLLGAPKLKARLYVWFLVWIRFSSFTERPAVRSKELKLILICNKQLHPCLVQYLCYPKITHNKETMI